MSESQPPQDGTAALREAIERLGEQGCMRVRQAIADMEWGKVPPQLLRFNPAQRAAALAELKAVMAVYDRPGDDA